MSDTEKKDAMTEAEVVKADKKADKKAEKAKKPSLISRIGKSLREYKSEMKKIVWYSREQTVHSSIVVIVCIVFIGAVIAIQMQINFSNPLLPSYTVGLATRDVLLLEFSSSILCLILAGKVGSNIASEIGTMRVTEQIDALEIMGVNSCNFIVLPKILALLTFIPVLAVFSMFLIDANL